MPAKLQSWWQRIKEHPVRSTVSIGAGLLGIALLVAFIGGYFFNWDWTGFSSYTPPVKDSNFQRGKTLWDWLNLLGVLAIPAVVGLGAAWYTAQQGKVSERESTDNQRETALQAYIDKMSELLLHEKLCSSAEKDEVRKIAHVRTLTILSRIDAYRKRSVLLFLYECQLIVRGESIVDLKGADLSNALLYGASLNKADLCGADLRGVDLRRANLEGANLSDASLYKANLSGADLRNASLNEALLNETDLSEANLEGANFTKEQLDTARSLKGATMPDGSKHP